MLLSVRLLLNDAAELLMNVYTYNLRQYYLAPLVVSKFVHAITCTFVHEFQNNLAQLLSLEK